MIYILVILTNNIWKFNFLIDNVLLLCYIKRDNKIQKGYIVEVIMGALDGITVVDMSRYIAGPYCSMLLGDMGADVIKVERREKGEDSRALIPFQMKGDEKVSLYYTQYNKNKRSLSVDFRNPESIELLKKLLAKADVLVENFRPGTLDKMGLGREVLQEINPRLIVTSISGFGQEGEFRDRAAFDCIGQVMGGLMGLTGHAGGEPVLVGSWIGDFTTALYAAFGTVCAIMHQKQTGKGQFLDLCLVECVSSVLATVIPDYCANGRLQPLRGNRDTVCAPANLFKCRDGSIYFHGGTAPLWIRLTDAMGQPELREDPRFITVEDRMAHVEEIEAICQEWIGGYTAKGAEKMLVEAGIPCGVMATAKDLVESPLLKSRQAIVYKEYPGVGEVALPGVVVKMSETPGEVRRRPPMLGEHNLEILQEFLGLTPEEVEALAQKKII